jgi:hypothetical protein
LKQAGVKVQLPSLGSCLLVWARSISKDFYEASLSTQDSGYTNWLVKIHTGQVTPIKCTLYFTKPESLRILLAEQLKLNSGCIREAVFLSWIKEFEDATTVRE